MNDAPKRSIGIPNGMLSARDRILLHAFFEGLGFPVVVTNPSTRETLETGSRYAVDETCLAFKMYLGHVAQLIGKCDFILIPHIRNYGHHRQMCTRFESMYDVARNTFRDTQQQFITYDVDVRNLKREELAFVQLGMQLGCGIKETTKAYTAARKIAQKEWKAAVKAEEALLSQEGFKILVVGHSYVMEDDYIGKPVMDALRKSGVIPIRADIVDRKAALKHSAELSPTCKWEFSRELVGSVEMRKEKVDGIILLSTFPCGPDAMVNDLLLRRAKGMPMLNLVLDGQSGTAGMETRLESFVDIIRFREGKM